MALSFAVFLLSLLLLHQPSDGLTWENCRSDDQIVTLKTISVQPDPISLAGQISVEGSAYLERSISFLKAELRVEKKFLFWWKLPCDVIECTCDICQTLNLESNCSLSSGYFNFPPTTLNVPQQNLSSFWTNGQYRVTVLLKSSGKNVGCVEMNFNIENN
ncbi:ganglioside GM2 activator [Hemitrygon akajei]|uniref:ganglioside GM2 activator n=1 Tax=Hemitrygon akajei TaxID=2704970 RepID=UPI003BF99133